MYLYSFISNKCILYTLLCAPEHIVKKCLEKYIKVNSLFINIS